MSTTTNNHEPVTFEGSNKVILPSYEVRKAHKNALKEDLNNLHEKSKAKKQSKKRRNVLGGMALATAVTVAGATHAYEPIVHSTTSFVGESKIALGVDNAPQAPESGYTQLGTRYVFQGGSLKGWNTPNFPTDPLGSIDHNAKPAINVPTGFELILDNPIIIKGSDGQVEWLGGSNVGNPNHNVYFNVDPLSFLSEASEFYMQSAEQGNISFVPFTQHNGKYSVSDKRFNNDIGKFVVQPNL